MLSGEISLYSPPAKPARANTGLGRHALIAMILGLLTAASILLLIYQENRAVQYRIDAAEVWSAYQVKIVQCAMEEDPNLKKQYAEEQDLLRQRAEDLRGKTSVARRAVVISGYAALLLLFGAATAVFGLVANSIYAGYAGLLLGIIGVGLGVRALF